MCSDELHIHIIVACDSEGGIGLNGQIPWHLPADLKRFKELTMGKPVIMGRRTWESLPKKPLPGRLNIVLTSKETTATEVRAAHDLQDAIHICRMQGYTDIFVIGGSRAYYEALQHKDCKTIYMTKIHKNYKCDTSFPLALLQESKEWKIKSAQTVENIYSFVTLVKN